MSSTENQEKLYNSLTDMDDDWITEAGEHRFASRKKRRRWVTAIAAAVAVCVAAVGIWVPGHNEPVTTEPPGGGTSGSEQTAGEIIHSPALSQKLCLAEYPAMPPYPMDENDPQYNAKYERWYQGVEAQSRERGYAGGLETFFSKVTAAFLTDTQGENRLISPANIYMSLGMLAETTGGESRRQILSVLGYDGIEACRRQAGNIWNANYRQDGLTSSVLASSVWLSDRYNWETSAFEKLAKTYYTSSYKGKMGSADMDNALRAWLNDQTGGLLKDRIENLRTDPDTALALATTVYFKDQWSLKFNKQLTKPAVFHAPKGDVTCPFMHREEKMALYYRGKGFGTVSCALNGGDTMWLLLPDEGGTPESLVASGAAMHFLQQSNEKKHKQTVDLHLAMPQFDVSSEINLCAGFAKMGITDVLDSTKADFSPVLKDGQLAVSAVSHGVRVKVDEDGVTGAAYTLIVDGAAKPKPLPKIDFILDRPFLFAITGGDGEPLFVGVVNTPN